MDKWWNSIIVKFLNGDLMPQQMVEWCNGETVQWLNGDFMPQ